MQNIIELIGIIEGINFDGVINEMEVANLQKWVDQNRNLAYDPEQMKLISIIDAALKDKIISDDERQLILAYSKPLLLKYNDDETIYELNGIVEGIVCDGVVNEEEIYRLNEWRENHNFETYGQKECEELYSLLDKVIEDGIITESEKTEMLTFMTERVYDVQFETKLAYLKKQVKLKKNIGIDLISILDNADAMQKIHSRAERQLKATLNSYSGLYVTDPEIVIISLSIIAMLEYDGSYYSKVKKAYSNLYGLYNEQKIDGLIRTVLSKYRSEEDMKKHEKRLINVALYNSIVPSHFLGAFFDFIYDIYKLNFEFDLPDNLYEEFKFVYEGLKKNMMSDGDDVQLNVTKKTYKLIKTSKQLIADPNHLEAIIKYSILIVKLIDKKVWNKDIKIHNPYLKKGYESWCEKYQAHEEKKGTGKSSELRSRWEPKFMLEGNDVYLVPPVHRVKASYNPWSYYVRILCGDTVLQESADMDIREIIAGYRICGDKIKVEAPLTKVRYQLLANDTVIYDSKDKLYRDFIVFNSEGIEIKNNTDYKGNAIFCYRKNTTNLKAYYEDKKYSLASKIVAYGDSVFVSNIVFNFSSLQRPGVFGDIIDRHILHAESTNEKIPVYRQIKFLVFESENKYTDHELIINDVIHNLSEYHSTVSYREGVTKYVVDLPVNKAGVYKLSVVEKASEKRNRIAAFTFAVDPDYHESLMKLDDTEYVVDIKTAFCEESMHVSVNTSNYSESVISFEYGMNKYSLKCPLELDFYRLSNGAWQPLSDELWIGDVKSDTVLDIHDTDIDEMIVYSNYGQSLAQVKLKDKDIYKSVDIGFMLSYREVYDYELIVFLKDGKVKRAMFCNNHCIYKDDTEIIFNTGTAELQIIPSYYGKGNVYIEIFDEAGSLVEKSDFIRSGDKMIVSGLSSYEHYKIVISEKAKGLSLKKNREMKTIEQSFFARKDLVGNSFKLSEVYFVEEDNKKNKKLPSTHLQVVSMNEKGIYKGNIYWVNEKNGYMKLHLASVDVELCSEIIDGAVELIIKKNGKNLDINTMFANAPWDRKQKNAEIISYTAVLDR